MATGVETAGLVLATFPIVVICLKHYVEGVETVKRWHHYRQELTRYARKLETERILYLDMTVELLGDLVDPEDLRAMLLDPASIILWQKPEYKNALQTRLGTSYDNYVARAEDMLATLESIKQRLGIGPSGTVGESQFRNAQAPSQIEPDVR